jgi:uncharacterized protein (TIGR02246 family)
MELWELVAREEIRDTIIRYAHYADSGRADDFAGLFTEDAVLEIRGGAVHRGRDEIRGMLEGAKTSVVERARSRLIRHHNTNVLIDFDGPARARTRLYFLAVMEDGPDHWGRYRDVLVAQPDGRWRFEERVVRMDGHAPDGWRSAAQGDFGPRTDE